MQRLPARMWILAVVSALLQLLPFPLAGPVPLWRRTFCWFCIVPLLYLLLGRDSRGKKISPLPAALAGYACGVVWYLGNCYWIYPTMHVYGALPQAVAAGILLLFALYLGLYHALFAAIVAGLHQRATRSATLLLAPFVWVAVELARARITGFPWDLLGYSLIDSPLLRRLAPVSGVFGLSLVIAFANALWLLRVRTQSGWKARWPASLAAALVVLGAVQTVHAPEPASAAAVLVQSNLSVGAEARAPESREALLSSLENLSEHPSYFAPAHKAVEGIYPVTHALSESSLRSDLVLWPEAPADLFDGDPEFRLGAGGVAAFLHVPVIADSVGIERSTEAGQERKLYNSASFFDANGSYQGRYNKMHLVPFGEYTPYRQLLFFAGHLLDNAGGFTPGTERTLFRTGGHSYGVFICYESIFGDEIRELAEHGADVLVNLSDDGWYGDSSAPWEHLDMARMRALENHRWVLRSTNTGVTASISPDGVVVAQMPRHVRGAVDVPFAFNRDVTFYTRTGDWTAWMGVIVTLLGGAWHWRRPAHGSEAVH